jgi:hypothetical protein
MLFAVRVTMKAVDLPRRDFKDGYALAAVGRGVGK